MIYCVIGRKRSGKDTLFGIINKYKDVKRLAFADVLKDLCIDIYKIDRSYFYDDDKKDSPIPGWGEITPRTIVCEVGQQYRKKFGTDYWAQKLVEQIDSTMNYVVTDCRFVHEARLMKEQGACLVYIDADIRLGTMPCDSDVSEKSVYTTRDVFESDIVKLENNFTEEQFSLQSIFLLKLTS